MELATYSGRELQIFINRQRVQSTVVGATYHARKLNIRPSIHILYTIIILF
jgi:hypothetical protein